MGKLYSLDREYIRDMEQMRGDTTPITRMGRSIKNLGYAQIVMMILAVGIGVMLAGRIIGIATQSGSLEEFLFEFTDTLRIFLILLLLISLIGTFFFFRLYKSLRFIEEEKEFASPSIDRASKLFAVILLIQIIGLFVGLYFVEKVIQDLEQLAASNPTTADFEEWANNLTVPEEIIASSIITITINLGMLAAFSSIKEWTVEMHNRSGIFWFAEASNKLGTVRIGILIIVAGQIFNLVTLGDSGSIIQFLGSIILIVGYIQVGNRLEKVPLNIDAPVGMTQFVPDGRLRPIRQPLVNTEPLISTQPSSTEIYCTACGFANVSGSQFCNNCGAKFT